MSSEVRKILALIAKKAISNFDNNNVEF